MLYSQNEAVQLTMKLFDLFMSVPRTQSQLLTDKDQTTGSVVAVSNLSSRQYQMFVSRPGVMEASLQCQPADFPYDRVRDMPPPVTSGVPHAQWCVTL